MTKLVLYTQSIYFLFTGIWPLIHIDSFMAVTGPKTDVWLVKTVGVLVTCIGAVLLVSILRKNLPFELWLLAISSAAGLTAIDIWYVSNGTISKIYLLDVALEILLIAGLILIRRKHKQGVSWNLKP